MFLSMAVRRLSMIYSVSIHMACWFKSTLLNINISFCFNKLTLEIINLADLKYVSELWFRSRIPNMMSASEIFLKARSIPIFSMVSSVSLMPAVSMNRNVLPLIFKVSSMVSRVVPAMSETMALSSPSKALRIVLFPALVSPTIATGVPLLMVLPSLKNR